MAEPPSSPDPGISQFVDEPSTPSQVHDDLALAAESQRDDSIAQPLPKAEVATVRLELIEKFEQILAKTSLSHEGKVIKPEMPNEDTSVKSEMPDMDMGVKSEIPNQDTSIKPEIKEDPFGQPAADNSSPGPDMHDQVKLDPFTLPESALEASSSIQSRMNQWANSPSPSQPVQTQFRITRSMTKAKSLTSTQRTLRLHEYSLSGTGQAHTPFGIIEPLETAQEDYGNEKVRCPTSGGASDLSDVEFTLARPASSAAGSRKRRRPILPADKGLLMARWQKVKLIQASSRQPRQMTLRMKISIPSLKLSWPQDRHVPPFL
jgi:hypothetical protein